METCKWTVQVGQATSLICIPDPSDFKPVDQHMSGISQGKGETFFFSREQMTACTKLCAPSKYV